MMIHAKHCYISNSVAQFFPVAIDVPVSLGKELKEGKTKKEGRGSGVTTVARRFNMTSFYQGIPTSTRSSDSFSFRYDTNPTAARTTTAVVTSLR